MLLQFPRTLLISSTLFYFQTEEHSCTELERLYMKQRMSFCTNMLTNVYTSPEGFGVGRQLL